MIKRKILFFAIIFPVLFVGVSFFVAGSAHASSGTLRSSIETAKSQQPNFDRSSIRGSVAYAKYQGEIIEQDEFADSNQEVLGASTKVADRSTIKGSINFAKQNSPEVKGLEDTKDDVQVLKNFDGINRGSLLGSIDFAKHLPKQDSSTLKGSLMVAYSQSL